MSISRVVPVVTPKVIATPPSDPKTVAKTDDVEAPYTSYEVDNNHSYLVDHYELGESASEFTDEIKTIDGYFKSQADRGKIDNSVSTIKSLIAKYEKMANIDKSERTVMKVAKLAEYVKFLKSTEEIDKNLEKYGGFYK